MAKLTIEMAQCKIIYTQVHVHTCTPTCSQTVMLSVVDKLIRHVESSQLTFDLGGFLPYNHKEWIQLRMVSCDFPAWSCDFLAKPCEPFTRSCEPPA